MRREPQRQRALAGIAAGLLVGAVAMVLWQPGDAPPLLLAAGTAARADGASGEVPLDRAELRRSSLAEADEGDGQEAERLLVVESVVEDARIARWVEDLRDDGIPWNGQDACWALVKLPPGRLPEVETALRAYDLQQRHFAASVLRHRAASGSPVSPDLLRVAVEGLRSDVHVQTPWLESLASVGVCFLVDHAAAAAAPLRMALDGNNEQQRFLAAFVLTRTRAADLAPRIAHELVRHLESNNIGGDALMAVNGIYMLGNAALPTVREWRPFVDGQARALLDLVELDLCEPPRDVKQLRARRRLHDVTCLYHDPAIEYQVGRSPVARFGD